MIRAPLLSFGLDEVYLSNHSELLAESTTLKDGTRVFPVKLPAFEEGREIGEACLRLPPGFPGLCQAEIWLDSSLACRVPHVENTGRLCIKGDPGPTSGATPQQRIDQLLKAFKYQFCIPWNCGELDSHFREESLNYWAIHCLRKKSSKDPVAKILLLENRYPQPRFGDGILLPDKRWVVFGEDTPLLQRTLSVIGKGERRQKVLVCELPIPKPLTPDTWPKSTQALERIVRNRLLPSLAQRFMEVHPLGKRQMHRIVILRAPDCSYGFLLPGGPTTSIRHGYSRRVVRAAGLIPLVAERLDTSWICGRDQHPQVKKRQDQRVLIVGTGALGSFVAEHLVKAGVGHLTLIDPDSLLAANLGRHLLGANMLGGTKVHALANQLSAAWPAVEITPFSDSFEQWLRRHTLSGINLVLDLSGEPEVRNQLEHVRQIYPCRLLIGWMEPFVAAAHACLLPEGCRWSNGDRDPLNSCAAIAWPDDVMIREPACSSMFQSYTHAAASHAVALVAEAAISLLDDEVTKPTLRTMARGERYLRTIRPDLTYNDRAAKAASFEAVTWDEPWHA